MKNRCNQHKLTTYCYNCYRDFSRLTKAEKCFIKEALILNKYFIDWEPYYQFKPFMAAATALLKERKKK